MLGEVGPDHLRLTAAARFANGPVRGEDGLRWDVSGLHQHALDGLRAAVAAAPGPLASIGIDSWAVDYGLLRGGWLLAEPFHYRDERRGERGPRLVHERVPAVDLYSRTGLQFLPFNTVYQLAADPQVTEADRLLLVPDLLAHWLTGAEVTERTNASTTGLLSVMTGEWDEGLIATLGLPRGLFTDLVDPGATIGTLLPQVGAAVGAPGLSVVAVGSHDTASAVVGVPMTGDDAAYISLGTWGLVGLEIDTPVLTEAARASNFTHEGGVDHTIRFLTNVMGTWLLSETLRIWVATTSARCSQRPPTSPGRSRSSTSRTRASSPPVTCRAASPPGAQSTTSPRRRTTSAWCARSSRASPRPTPTRWPLPPP